MKNLIGKNVLVTTAQWFYAPDGKPYRAVFGKLHAINTSEATLGFTPSRTHTNWYLQVGNMSIAGCQVQYAIETDSCEVGNVEDHSTERTFEASLQNTRVVDVYQRPSHIYDAGQ